MKTKRGRPRKKRGQGILPNDSLTRKVFVQRDNVLIFAITFNLFIMALITILTFWVKLP